MDQALKPSDQPLPLYGQIRNALRARILDGSYAPGTQVPSESALGQLYSASRITVRQALSDLQKEGLIYKVHGKGSFVSRPKAFQNVSTLQGFAEQMSTRGYEVLNQLLSLAHAPASQQVANRLQLPEGALATEIRRVRLLDRADLGGRASGPPAGAGRPGHPRHLPDPGERLRRAAGPCRPGDRRRARGPG